MLIITLSVDAVTAEHEYHRSRRGKHVLSTYRTIAIRDTLDTFVRVLKGNGYTDTTSLSTFSSVKY